MRVGIFGNTNNYPLLLAMGLRELGVDVRLVVNRKEQLHRPESKYPKWENGYPDWIMDCSDVDEAEWVAAGPRLRDVINFLAASSDGLVLNDLGPSLMEFCGRPAVALMTGSDVSYYGDARTVDVRWQGASPEFRSTPGARLEIRRWNEFIARQRAGIQSAKVVSAPLPGLVPAIDDLLRGIGVPDARRDFFYLADVANAAPRATARNQRLRVVNGARLNWKKPLPAGFSSQDHKGTDTLLSGFAEFMAAGGDAELVLFRKGLHVAETEALARALGIASRIIWRDEMSLRDFYAELARADIVCDQLGESFPGLVALDAMALGIPVIANFQPEIMGRYFPEPVAARQARTRSEVANHLATLAESESARAAAGEAGRQFARTHLSPKANAVKCLRHLGLQ
jgi:glycosyltransferase involved in cell wall biosynthesis